MTLLWWCLKSAAVGSDAPQGGEAVKLSPFIDFSSRMSPTLSCALDVS
jgi:hypothetical protein